MNKLLCVLCLLTVSVPCPAIKPTGAPPATSNAAPPKQADPQAAKEARDDSSGLRKGTIEGVSLGGGTFHVYGQRLTFNAKQVKVFGPDGKPSSIYALRIGARIRFALDATDPLRRRVALIYVD
jgi:hypothetical protein